MNRYQVALSAIGPLVSGIFVIINVIFTHRKKKQLKIDIEKYKHQLQSDFLKTQHQTSKLYAIYPELYSKMISLAGSFNVLNILTKEKCNIDNDYQMVISDYKEATNFRNEKALFISEEVEELTSQILRNIIKILKLYQSQNNLSPNEITEKNDLVVQQVKTLKTQMIRELSEKSVQ
jgi:hypothetical protein